jgi:hypothetical protein
MTDDRAPVIIHGNCQAQVLHLLVSRVPSLTERFSFHLVTDTEPGAPVPAPPVEAPRAVLAWAQYDRRPDLALRDELLECVPSTCAVVRYPAVSMNAFWPFRIKCPRNRPEPGFPWGRYPIGDRVALRVAELGLPPADAFARYMEDSIRQMPDLEHRLDLDREIYARRDLACDVTMGDVAFARLRDTYQFWTYGHLAASLFATLLTRLIECSSTVLGGIDDRLRDEIAAAVAGYPGQGDMQSPVHPLVIERLGLTFVDPSTRYRWHGNGWTFEEYYTRYIGNDASWTA